VDGWNETATKAGLVKVGKLTDGRRRAIKVRVKEHGLDSLLVAFARVGASDFLTGQVEGRDGRQPFRASFDWTLAPSNLAKVMEGTYDNRGGVSPFRRGGNVPARMDEKTLAQYRGRGTVVNVDATEDVAGGEV
jgi:hypothetical protein